MKLPAEKSLKETIERARTLDPKAITEIFEHYYAKIYRFLYYRARTAQDAEDLASEVFVKGVKSISRQKGNFEPWLYMIARNTLTDYYRRKAGNRENALDEEIVESLAVEKKAGDEPFAMEDLKFALNKLTEEQQQVVTLKFIENYDNESIARIMGKTIGAVKALQFRALAALKDILKEG